MSTNEVTVTNCHTDVFRFVMRGIAYRKTTDAALLTQKGQRIIWMKQRADLRSPPSILDRKATGTIGGR
jgi:hypothetical protein